MRNEERTNIIRITYISNKPRLAKDVANKVAEVYVEENFKRKNKEAYKTRVFIENSLASVEKRLKKAEDALRDFKEKEVVTGVAISLEGRLADLQKDYQDMLAKATEKHPDVIRLKGQVQEIQEQLKKLPASELEFARLKRDVDVNEKLYTMLRERFEESRINEAQQVADASIVNPATEPRIPIRPNKKFAFIVGIIVGSMLSLILAFVTENLDASISTIEDVVGVLKLPVLAVIPSAKSEEKEKAGWLGKLKRRKVSQEDEISVGLIAHLKPFSQMAESFRILRTNLKISEGRKTILITSAGPREGKSSVLMGVAVTLSQVGVNTLVVDSDLRRPSINKLIGIERENGINELLAGKAKFDDCLKGLPDIMMGDLG
jgi:tyrosine-protein kinase Etk/Wzc